MKPQPTYPRKKNKLWYIPIGAVILLIIVSFILWGTQRPQSTITIEQSFNNDIEVTVRGHKFHFKNDSSLYYYLLSIQSGSKRDEARIAFLQNPNDIQQKGLADHYNMEANYYSSLAIRYDSIHSGIYRIMGPGIFKQSDSGSNSFDNLK